ncbi:MAG: helix-turn-helix domain-containing protein [Ruminococcaceae bacterium]|nr:helix-turn-helix domain-containing protein [Oscillospiraceae bacterium]
MNYDFSNMGDNISRLRRRIGMTQEMLAYRLGVSAQAVSKWERQISCPDVSLLPQMAEIFGVSIDELFIRSVMEEAEMTIEELPWENDDTLRVAVFKGKKLQRREIYPCTPGEDTVLLIHHGGETSSTVIRRRMKGNTLTPPE